MYGGGGPEFKKGKEIKDAFVRSKLFISSVSTHFSLVCLEVNEAHLHTG